MLFISRGRTLRFHDLYSESLISILKKYLGSGFTGRFVVNTSKGVVEIDVLNGRIMAALAREEEKGTLLEGDRALEFLESISGLGEGFVEVIELDENKVRIDIDTFPSSRLSAAGEDILARLLGGQQSQPAGEVSAEGVESREVGLVASAGEDSEVANRLRGVLRDLGILVRIVLNADRSEEKSFSSIDEARTVLRELAGPDRLVYARCRATGSGSVIHVLCLERVCVEELASGASGGVSGSLGCKVYVASRTLVGL